MSKSILGIGVPFVKWRDKDAFFCLAHELRKSLFFCGEYLDVVAFLCGGLG